MWPDEKEEHDVSPITMPKVRQVFIISRLRYHSGGSILVAVRAAREGCGGAPGYFEFLNALKDPNHEEHESYTK